MRKAIAVILIGENGCYERWNQYVRPAWDRYAKAHNYDIHCIRQPIVEHPTKGPAWQKCCLFQHEPLKDYDWIVSLDHDIIIRDGAPDVVTGVPEAHIGVVTWSGSMGHDPYVYHGAKRMWQLANVGIWNDDPPKSWSDVFTRMKLPPIEDCLNTGVMVLHRVMRFHMQNVWSLGIDNEWSAHEQTAFAWWLLHERPQLRYDLDRRFNLWVPHEVFAHYEWCASLGYTKETMDRWVDPYVAMLNNNWFLHFMGDAQRAIPLVSAIQEHHHASGHALPLGSV